MDVDEKSDGLTSARGRPTICLCILMNHPFPANIPLLREIYEGRFTFVRFLIPFERLPDDDVITVYRGSYNHAAYLTDAYRELSGLDCDYFIVAHDDVLLNPALSCDTFRDVFNIGPDDGFVARIGPTAAEAHQWSWLAGFVPKLLYPKSMLFGGGLEIETLQRFLPSDELIRAKAEARGVEAVGSIRVSPGFMHLGSMPDPSRLILYGLSEELDPQSQSQAAIARDSADAARLMFSAIAEDVMVRRTGQGWTGEPVSIPLPFPLLTSGYVTDFYILPRSRLESFCHYVGVAAAANLFVEIVAPTILLACCERLFTAHDLDLDFRGFDQSYHLNAFLDRRSVAIHPIKLSTFGRPDRRSELLSALAAVRDGRPVSEDSMLARATFGRWPGGFFGWSAGWHSGENWGVWSAQHDVEIPVELSKPTDLRVILQAPMTKAGDEMTGSLKADGVGSVAAIASFANPRLELTLIGVTPDADGIARIQLHTDALVRPCDLNELSRDTRALGFGLIRVETV